MWFTISPTNFCPLSLITTWIRLQTTVSELAVRINIEVVETYTEISYSKIIGSQWRNGINTKSEYPWKETAAWFRLVTGYVSLTKHLYRIGLFLSPACVISMWTMLSWTQDISPNARPWRGILMEKHWKDREIMSALHLNLFVLILIFFYLRHFFVSIWLMIFPVVTTLNQIKLNP